MNKKRFYFSLRTVFLALVCVSAYLLAFAALPKLAMPGLFIAAFVTIMVYIFTRENRRLEPSDSPQPDAIGSYVLTSVSAWTIGFVLISALRIIPGSFGPIQYAGGDMVAMFVFNLRIVTILVMTVSPIVCSLIGSIRLFRGIYAQADWLALGLGSYVIAWVVLFWNLWFIPTV